MDVMTSQALGLGKWTATPQQNPGTIITVPAKVGSGQKTYMYVQHVVGSGAAAYRGTPCGFAAACTDGTFIVNSDQSAALKTAPVGVYTKSDDEAITTTYYGWIQLAKPFEVLEYVALDSSSAAEDRVYWGVDGYLSTTAPLSSITDIVPIGVVLTPAVATGHISSAANLGYADVLVLGSLGE